MSKTNNTQSLKWIIWIGEAIVRSDNLIETIVVYSCLPKHLKNLALYS